MVFIKREIKCLFFVFLLVQGLYGFAQNTVDRQIQEIVESSSDTTRVLALNKLGQQYWVNDFVSARHIFNTSLGYTKLLKNKRLQASTLIYLGYSYSNTSLKDSARYYYNEALRINKEINNSKGIAQCYNSLSSLEIKVGNYDKALNYIMNALKLAEVNKDTINISKAYNSLGVLYDEQGLTEQAIKNYKQSLFYKKLLGDKHGLAMTFNNLGNVHKTSRQLDSSLFYYKQAEGVLSEMNNASSLAMVYTNIAGLYSIKENFKEAIEYLKKASGIYSESGDEYGKATALYSLGNIYQMNGEKSKAIETLKECEQAAINSEAKELQKDIYKAYASLYAEFGNFESAYKYLALFNAIKDSLTSEANARMINEISTKYETGQKEKTIALLNKDKQMKEVEIETQKRFQFFLVSFILLGVLLGIALLKGYLNKKKSNLLLEKQKIEINHQRELLQEKNNDITDSINYAQRLQRSILPSNTYLRNHLPEHFLLYKPKDIVSGDFYWSSDKGEKLLFAVADCTGHGVPGAFMSILGSNLLNEIVNEKNVVQPDTILNLLRDNVIRTLNSEDADYKSMDGMDISLIAIDKKTNRIDIANANNSIWVYSAGEIEEIKSDKYPVGYTHENELKPFTLKGYHANPGDVVYLFSDGYADQFGGPQGKKYKYKPLKELLASIGHKSMEEQREILDITFEEWKGNLQQVDDVLLVGIRF